MSRLKPHHHLGIALLFLGVCVFVAAKATGVFASTPCGTRLLPAALEPRILDAPQSPSPLDHLAHEFEPTVVVARADRNWPTSIQTVLDLSVAGRLTCLRSRPGCIDPEDPAAAHGAVARRDCPQATHCHKPLEPADIPTGGSSDDWLIYPTPLSDSATQQQELGSAIAGSCVSQSAARTLDPQLSFDPHPFAQEYFFASSELPPKFHPDDLHLDRLAFNPPVQRPLKSLQYWFFYPFNYLPASPLATPNAVVSAPGLFPTVDYHQGDFEHIDVILDAMNRIVGVYMARHRADEAATLPLSSVVLEPSQGNRTPTHPVVFASLGGHASYESCRPVARRLTSFLVLYDYPVCPADPTALGVSFRPPSGATIGPAYVFRNAPLVSLEPSSWACWNGRFGDVPRIPAPVLQLYRRKHLERLPRLEAWSKLNLIKDVYPLQAAPAAPLTQDGTACGTTLSGPPAALTNPQG